MAVLPHPDPAQGLFETLLALDGEPIELGAHLSRLAASLEELYGTVPTPGLAATVREHAAVHTLGRVRIAVAPDGSLAELASEAVDPADLFPGPARAVALDSLPRPGGLGPHKWADRRPLGETRGRRMPLLLDGEEVLEGGRANVFAAFAGVLATPRADGRILPGIARAGAIAAAREEGIEVEERRLRRSELLAADEVFLTGSVRGVEPARNLDGEPLAGGGELSRRVGDGLRRRWSRAPVVAAAPALAGAPPPGRHAR